MIQNNRHPPGNVLQKARQRGNDLLWHSPAVVSGQFFVGGVVYRFDVAYLDHSCHKLEPSAKILTLR
jgi:hypothetical protein